MMVECPYATETIYCNKCNETQVPSKEVPTYGCRQCEYDICHQCFTQVQDAAIGKYQEVMQTEHDLKQKAIEKEKKAFQRNLALGPNDHCIRFSGY